MALNHAEPGEPWDVRPLGHELAAAKTTALFKAEHLEVIRLVLLAGQELPPHKVAGEITLQCLEGELLIEVQSDRYRLPSGRMLYLTGGEVHKVVATQDSSALLTIALVQMNGN